MDIEVVVSTYNKPAVLNLVLTALSRQDRADFGICAADDGSTESTAEMIKGWRERLGAERLRHVWHADDGFQKNRILNKAIASSSADYLIFIDGDCVARRDFVDVHLRRRRPGCFLSGGMVRLSRNASEALNAGCIDDGSAFSAHWLRAHMGRLSISTRLKAALLPTSLATFFEQISPVKRTWNGADSSGWRRDIEAVNGFDERLRYGAEDVEMGVRMVNNGVRALPLRYSAALLHIDHDRPYADPTVIAANKLHVDGVRRQRLRWTEHGIHPGVVGAPEGSPQ